MKSVGRDRLGKHGVRSWPGEAELVRDVLLRPGI